MMHRLWVNRTHRYFKLKRAVSTWKLSYRERVGVWPLFRELDYHYFNSNDDLETAVPHWEQTMRHRIHRRSDIDRKNFEYARTHK